METMSLYGYKPKTKKAPWVEAFGEPKAEKKQKPVSAISDTERVRKRDWATFLSWWAPLHRWCAVCGRQAVDGHHTRGKLGKLNTDPRWIAPLCRGHHDMVKDDPAWARDTWVTVDEYAMPLLAPLGKWHVWEPLVNNNNQQER